MSESASPADEASDCFEEPVLRFLGRRHSVEEAVRCVEESLAAGLETVSLDLIYGVPEEVGANLAASLDRTIAVGPDHVSCYQLTVHEGTPFARKKERGALRELSDDDLGAVFETTHDRLEAAGLFPYEVSNFASSPEHRSIRSCGVA